jgi:hypothetical protein
LHDSRWETAQDLKDEVLQLASIMLCCHPDDWFPMSAINDFLGDGGDGKK